LNDGRAQTRNSSGRPTMDFEKMKVSSQYEQAEKGGNIKNAQLKKTLLKFKKAKKPTTCKGGMSTVKIDF